MYAMVCRQPGQPLQYTERSIPTPQAGEVVIRVRACGVCRTDLHIVDGDLPLPAPVVPGHEIVGVVAARGSEARRFALGARVGVPWLGGTCRLCPYCVGGRENLCDAAVFTGYHRDGDSPLTRRCGANASCGRWRT